MYRDPSDPARPLRPVHRRTDRVDVVRTQSHSKSGSLRIFAATPSVRRRVSRAKRVRPMAGAHTAGNLTPSPLLSSRETFSFSRYRRCKKKPPNRVHANIIKHIPTYNTPRISSYVLLLFSTEIIRSPLNRGLRDEYFPTYLPPTPCCSTSFHFPREYRGSSVPRVFSTNPPTHTPFCIEESNSCLVEFRLDLLSCAAHQ